MTMVCAQCSQVFYGKERQCPKCGIALLVQQHNIAKPDAAPPVDPMDRWQQTPWGRIVVSVAIAQGVAYCLRILFTAHLPTAEAAVYWNSVEGLVLLNAFNCAALLACGMLAGANQERGITSGGLVGLWNGLIFLALHRAGKETLDSFVFFAQPFVHMLFGLVGGLIGYRIWKPVPLFNVEEDMGRSGMGLPRPAKKLLRGPIHIVRVLIGSAVAVAGAIFAREVLDIVMRQMGSTYTFRSYTTERLVIYQVIAVVTFVGGAIAGSSSRNGFKQGLCAAVLTAALYLSFQLANPKSVLEVTLFVALAAAGMCLLGGVFGSLLFPPLVKGPQKKAIPY